MYPSSLYQCWMEFRMSKKINDTNWCVLHFWFVDKYSNLILLTSYILLNTKTPCLLKCSLDRQNGQCRDSLLRLLHHFLLVLQLNRLLFMNTRIETKNKLGNCRAQLALWSNEHNYGIHKEHYMSHHMKRWYIVSETLTVAHLAYQQPLIQSALFMTSLRLLQLMVNGVAYPVGYTQ